MKKIVFPGLVAGVVLLIISYAGLYLSIQFFPKLVEEFYNPIFYPGEDRPLLYFIHPFVLSFALAWFWERFKEMFKGSFVVRGFELGIVYGVVATLPAITTKSPEGGMTLRPITLRVKDIDADQQEIQIRLPDRIEATGPDGKPWGDTTIRGHVKRGTGLVNNELNIGRLIWNRLRYIKDPSTGQLLMTKACGAAT